MFASVLHPLVASTGFHNNNLALVDSNQLLSGKTYRFVLTAETHTGERGASEIEFTMNSQPSGGSVSCTPTIGMAVRDVFFISSPSWIDDDTPLVYRFGTQTNISTSYLTDFGPSSTRALLPEGHSVEIMVEVMDHYGAHL